MNPRLARQILQTYRPSGEDDDERDVRTAIRVAAKHPAVEAEFQNQLAFDRAVALQLEAEPLPAAAATALGEAAGRLEARRPRRLSFRDPAMLSAAVAFLCVVGLLTWIFLGQMGSFAGMQEVAEMVTEADAAGPERFTELETPAGALADWFVMQNFDGFVLPSELENAPVVGVRLFKYEGIPIAAAAIVNPRAILYVFEAQPLGLSLPADRWRIGSFGAKGDRAFAARQVGGMAVVLALRGGGATELKDALARLPEAR